MIEDGEVMKCRCGRCGHEFEWVIAYGLEAPSDSLKNELLEADPPKCPKCGSHDFEEITLWDRILDFFFK